MTPPNASQELPLVRDPVEELAEVFLERYRRGERPPLSDFIARAPEHGDEIRELFPALILMEQAGPGALAFESAAVCQLERLGDYRLIREVGRGGMGIVYEAEQEALGRHVALKILPVSAMTGARSLVRFRREARSAARLHHTNIVPVFDIGEREGIHYYAMQFIQGRGLDEVIAELRRLRQLPDSPLTPRTSETSPCRASCLAEGLQSGRFQGEELVAEGTMPTTPTAAPVSSRVEPGVKVSANSRPSSADSSDFSNKSEYEFYRSVARVGLQVAEALAYAHVQRVLHRDIKPSNLLLDAAGCAWVTDFGLAKEEGDELTRTGDVVGTLRYMAPERLNGTSEARSDIYGLGVTLYELLTLQPTFPQSDRASLINHIARHEPVAPRQIDPRVPRDLETIIFKAIAKEPARRYACAADMAEDLRRFLMDRPIRARRASQLERTWRWCRRNPGWASTVATALALLVFIAIGGSVLSLYLRQALHDARAADEEKTEKLWQSHLQRARALRSSGREGQRFEALKAIREAAKIKVTPELRDEAVAALVLPDVEIAREWEMSSDASASVFTYDAKLERYARINKEGAVTICRLTAGGEEVIGRIAPQGEGRCWGLWMSPDGRFLAYAHGGPRENAASSVRIFRLDSPTPVFQFEDRQGMTEQALNFHEDGRHLAIGHQDQSISIYDLEKPESITHLQIPQMLSGLAFNPRELTLAVACRNCLYLFDIITGKELPRLQEATRSRAWSFGLAWRADGRVLAAVAADKTIRLWDVQTAQELVSPMEAHASEGIVLAFNQTGDRLLSSGWDGLTCLWDAIGGRLMLTMSGERGSRFARTRAANSIGADSLIGMEQDGKKMRLWRLADGRELLRICRPKAEHAGELSAPILDADGRILAAASRDMLVFFDAQSGKELAAQSVGRGVHEVPRTFDRAGGWLTSGTKGALFWPQTVDPEQPGKIRVGPPRPIADAIDSGSDASPDGRLRIIPQRQHALLLDEQHPKRRLILKRQTDVRNAAVSPDGRWAATFSWWSDGRSNCAGIWEVATGKYITDLAVEPEAGGYFSPDSRWLTTYARNRGIQLWKTGDWQPGMQFAMARGACWNPANSLLAVTDTLGAIRLIDPENGRKLFELTGPSATWYSPACFSADGARLIATAGDRTGLVVWDLRLIRRQLQELGMDWDLPELPANPELARSQEPLTVQIDPGFLRQPLFADDWQALAVLSVAIATQPFCGEAYLHRGMAYGRLQKHASAIADYQSFLMLSSGNDLRRPEVYLRIAANYESLRDTNHVLETLAQVVDAPLELIPWPGNFTRMCNDAAWEQVKPSNATITPLVISLLDRAVEITPLSSDYLNTYGVAMYRMGRFAEAVRFLDKSLELRERPNPFDLYFLAMSHARLGQRAKALACFEQATNLVQAEPNIAKKLIEELRAFRIEAEQTLGIVPVK